MVNWLIEVKGKEGLKIFDLGFEDCWKWDKGCWLIEAKGEENLKID